MHALIVDDEPLIRWSLAETLCRQGWVVVEAGSARAALAAIAAAERRFDVVLLDFRLPDSNDLGLLASIRAQSPPTRVILMTAFGAADVLEGAARLGAAAIVHKPFDLDEVAALARRSSSPAAETP